MQAESVHSCASYGASFRQPCGDPADGLIREAVGFPPERGHPETGRGPEEGVRGGSPIQVQPGVQA